MRERNVQFLPTRWQSAILPQPAVHPLMSHPDDGNSLLRPDHYLDAAIELLFFD